MIVRRVIEQDLPEVMEMARRFHGESPHHRVLSWNEDKVARLVTAAMVDPDWYAIVAVDDDGLVGMALVYALPAFFSDDRELADLAFYVDPDRRGGRAALRMAQAIINWGTEQRVARVTLGIHTGINHESALSFFKKLGFGLSGYLVAR